MSQGVDMVGLYVRDQEEALAFYVEKLGFRVHTDVKNGDYRWLTIQHPDQPSFQLGLFKPESPALAAATAQTLREIVAKGAMPPLVLVVPDCRAAYDRMRRGLEPIAPNPELRTAANFLWMRTGEKPIKEAEAVLDMYLVLLADHSYNASAFSARVTASTNADIYGAITAALATLTGDLHGGAPSGVMTMLEKIGSPEKAEAYVRELLGRGGKIMGMGHREYKIRDPRAEHLEESAKALNEKAGTPWYKIARALEDAADKVLRELKPGRQIYANVDFYTAPALFGLGIPSDEFTCMFACGRMAGWTAHVLEQLAHNRLIRPQATYVGPDVHPLVPIAGCNGHAAEVHA